GVLGLLAVEDRRPERRRHCFDAAAAAQSHIAAANVAAASRASAAASATPNAGAVVTPDAASCARTWRGRGGHPGRVADRAFRHFYRRITINRHGNRERRIFDLRRFRVGQDDLRGQSHLRRHAFARRFRSLAPAAAAAGRRFRFRFAAAELPFLDWLLLSLNFYFRRVLNVRSVQQSQNLELLLRNHTATGEDATVETVVAKDNR